MDLHIFCNGTDYVVASTAEEAQAVLVAMDYDPEDAAGDGWVQWPDDKPFSCRRDEEDAKSVRQLPAEWIAENGRGFLCSEEV